MDRVIGCFLALLGALLFSGCSGGGGGSSGTSNNSSTDLPDIVVTSFSAPSFGTAGQTYTVTGSITNQGSAPAVGAAVVYLSAKSDIEPREATQASIGLDAYIGLLNPGQSWNFSIDVDIPTESPNGDFYIGVLAPYSPDYESNPGNNVQRQAFAISGGTDCNADSHEPDDSVSAASDLTFGVFQAHNHCEGTSDWMRFSATAGTAYGIATDALGDDSWPWVELFGTDGQTLLAVSAGSLWDFDSGRITWTAPANGTYYIRTLPSFGFSNSGSESDYRVAFGDVLPDLAVPYFYSSSTGLPGGSISVNDTARNQGFAAAGGFDVSVYLSADATVDTGDLLLGTRAVSPLTVGESNYSPTLSYSLPSGLAVGTYYVAAIADAGGAVNEFSSSNNTSPTRTLVVSAPVGCTADSYEEDETPAAANPIVVSAAAQAHNHCEDDTDWLSFAATSGEEYAIRVTRVGGYARGWVEVYDPAGTTRLAGNGASETTAIDWQAPSSDTYYLKLGGTLGNATDYTIKVEKKLPDFTQTLSSNTPSVKAGDFLRVYDTVTNVGYATSGAFEVGFYRSIDNAVDTGDAQAATRTVSGLGTQGSGNYANTIWSSVHFPKDTPPGTYYLGAIADWNAAIPEVSETNNTSAPIQVNVTAPTCAVDLYEDDDVPGTAKPIALNETQARNYCDDGIDWVSFTPAVSGVYVAYASDNGDLTLYASDGVTYVPIQDSYLYSRLSFNATGGTTYLLKGTLAGFSGSSYELSVFQCGQDAYEEDDDYTAAKTIAVGETQSRNFCEDSSDWVKFDASAGVSYTIIATADNLRISLHDTDGTTTLASGTPIQGGKKQRIIWTAPSSGTYYVKVRWIIAFGQDTNYTLDLQ